MTTSSKREALVFLSGKRTPFGSNGGSLKDVNPTALALAASRAALEQSTVDPGRIDHVVLGNVLHSAPDSIYSPRHVGLQAGVPEAVPALGINRLCGSGFQAIIEAFQQMAAGDSEVALVGGVENMSMSPYVLRGARWGMRMGNQQATDMMMEALFDTQVQLPMALTAENLARKYKITREASDEFSLRSQRLCREAREAGRFSEEISPFPIVDRKGKENLLAHDEHPKADSTPEGLARLKPVFDKTGIVTAGSASGIVDGAAMMVVSTESLAGKEGWKPLGRLVAYGVAGCDPAIMGIGPVPAARIALSRAGMKIEQMDLVEINEAFAPQALSVARELGIRPETFNVNGGAIAIGHPLAASGTRLTMTLLYELRRRKKSFGLAAACIGGGQGIALVVEAF